MMRGRALWLRSNVEKIIHNIFMATFIHVLGGVQFRTKNSSFKICYFFWVDFEFYFLVIIINIKCSESSQNLW